MIGLWAEWVSKVSGMRTVLWYLVPDESHTKDGRHIDYLEPTPANRARFRACDPELYDRLGELVRAGRRSVSAVPERLLLPAGTAYHTEPLDFSRAPRPARAALRQRWLAAAIDVAAGADVVFLDPDNGLEVGCDACDNAGPKYAFYEDLSGISPAQTLIVYQHATRNGGFEEQLEARMNDLARCRRLPRENLLAMRWRRVSPRAFIFAVADSHRAEILGRLRTMVAGPWGGNFDLVRPGPLEGT